MTRKIVQVQLPLFIWQEGDQLVVYTPALELSTCGANEKEALDNFHEAVELFFETAEERHTLNDLLESLGWEQRADHWIPASTPLPGSRAFAADVPVYVQ